MIYWLLIGIFLLLLINFTLNNGDIFAPSCMLTLVYFVCVLFSLYNYDLWNLNDYGLQAVELILESLTVFSIVSLFVNVIYNGTRIGKRRAPLSEDGCKSHIIDINSNILTLVIIFDLLIIILCVVNILKTGGGIVGWAMILNNYKALNATGDAYLPTYVQEAAKIVTACGYIYLFVFINNVIMSRQLTGNKRCLLPVLLHLTRSVLTGNRYNILCAFAGGAYALYILYQQKNGWARTFRFKYFRWGVLGLIGVLGLFVLLKRVSGRVDNIQPLYYTTMYTSGSVKAFDLYLKTPPPASGIWGKETFSGINNFLGSRGIGVRYNINLEFRYVNGKNLGNVYGAIRRFYQDFGHTGNLLLVANAAFIWNSIYSKLTKTVSKNRELLLIVFMFIVHALLIFPIDDKLYNNIFTPSFLVYIVIFSILYRIIVRRSKVKYFDE